MGLVHTRLHGQEMLNKLQFRVAACHQRQRSSYSFSKYPSPALALAFPSTEPELHRSVCPRPDASIAGVTSFPIRSRPEIKHFVKEQEVEGNGNFQSKSFRPRTSVGTMGAPHPSVQKSGLRGLSVYQSWFTVTLFPGQIVRWQFRR